MRIRLEIDDEQRAVTTVQSSQESPTPPPELLAAASELGATSAGPAPQHVGDAVGMTEWPGAEVAAFSATATDAGGAPVATSTTASASDPETVPERSARRKERTSDASA